MNTLALLVCILSSFASGFIYGWAIGHKKRKKTDYYGKITPVAMEKMKGNVISLN